MLGGRPLDPQWQGAFGRALGARAPGSHGRWRFDGDAAIEVAHVDVDGAAVVVAAVDAARAVANAYVDDLASEGRRRRAEEATQAAALEERAAIAPAR